VRFQHRRFSFDKRAPHRLVTIVAHINYFYQFDQTRSFFRPLDKNENFNSETKHHALSQTMEVSNLSVDSLGESELDLLRDKLKQKDHIIAEKSEIINSLRQQVNDLNHDLEEMENNQQFLNQKVDRLTKDLTTRDEELEAVSHALREIEAANEKLTKRMEARTGQIQKFVEDLVAAKKELEEARNQNEELKHKNEQLTIELEMANSRKRSLQEHEAQLKQQLLQQQQEQERQLAQRQPTNENKAYVRDSRFTQCRKERQHERRIIHNDGNHPELASTLYFPMADEIGEIMDSSSAFPPQMFSDNAHKSQAPKPVEVPIQVKREDPIWSPKVHADPLERKATSIDDHYESKKHPQVIRQAQSLNNENADNYCETHRQKRAQTIDNQIHDPITEYKLRMARANELARRNMQVKPLHQTSYPLELDTFDTTDLTEQEIKRGNVLKQSSRPPQRLPPQPPVSKSQLPNTPPQQQPKLRQALANCSNTPPVVRRVYKKAEAFIV
jgi:hypothetical protein